MKCEHEKVNKVVYVVTTPADAKNERGSLREAVEAHGRRTITFDVSEGIDLVGVLKVKVADD